MNIDKSNTPTWAKVVIWFTIAAFVLGFAAMGLIPLITSLGQGNANQNQAQGGPTTVATIASLYEPTTRAIEAKVGSDGGGETSDYITLGSTYTAWGSELSAKLPNDPEAQVAAANALVKASEAWGVAYEKDPSNKMVGGDYATSLYYIGNEEKAVEVARDVLEKNPDYGIVWFNLGNFLAQSDPQGAIEAFETSLKFDTDNSYSNQARAAIEQLKASN